MKKALKVVAILFALAFVGIQFVRPARMNPPVDETKTYQAKLTVSPEVEAVLTRSCNDCHSNKTDWIWYSNVAPVSWYLSHHVEEGRAELNLSEWGNYAPKRATHKLEEICEQIESGEMPLWDYALMHPSARLSDADKKLVCDWANAERDKIRAALPKDSQ